MGWRRAFLACFLLLVGPLVACSRPCDRLLDRLCGCSSARARAACAEARHRREARDREKLDEERCKKQLETFSCKHFE